MSLCISVSICNDSCNDSLCFVDLRHNAHDFPFTVGAKPKISSKIFTLLSTQRHKYILSSVRDIFHSCFKVWTLNPKHTLPFFHARTNSPKSNSVMRCCLTCVQHLCKPFGILQKKSESGRKRERERKKRKAVMWTLSQTKPIATLPVIIERKLSIKYKSTVINFSVTEEGRRGWAFQHSSACNCCYFTSAPLKGGAASVLDGGL